jgi:hypothetical protein
MIESNPNILARKIEIVRKRLKRLQEYRSLTADEYRSSSL